MTKTKAIWLSALCVLGSFGGLVLITVLTVRFVGWWVLPVPLLLSAWYALYNDFRRMP